MIINKIKPLWTEEELQQMKDLQAKIEDLYKHAHYVNGTMEEESNELLEDYYDDIDEIKHRVEARYYNSFNDNPKAIYNDIEEIISALEYSDFLAFTEDAKREQEDIITRGGSKKSIAYTMMERLKEKTFKNAQTFIQYQLNYQYSVIREHALNAKHLEDLINQKVLEWYPSSTVDGVSIAYPEQKLENLTKATSSLFNGNRNWNRQVYIDIAPNSNKAKEAKVLLEIDPNISSDIKLTPKDEGILSCAVSLASANPYGIITPHEVAKYFYYGNEGYSNPSSQQVSAVKKKLDLYANNRVTIDYTDHALLNGEKLKEGEKALISRYILPVDIVIVKANGKTVTGYKLIAQSPFFEYAEKVHQLTEIPSIALNVPVRLTEENINIREFLIKQIAHIQGNTSWGKTYTFDKIFEEAGIDISSEKKGRDKKSQKVKDITKMLDYWKKIKFIKGYTINRGKHNSAYSITFRN